MQQIFLRQAEQTASLRPAPLGALDQAERSLGADAVPADRGEQALGVGSGSADMEAGA